MDFDRLELKLLENFLIYKNYWGVHSKIEFWVENYIDFGV